MGRSMNRLVLQAQLIERSAIRYTPAGLPVLDFLLKHSSQVNQEGQPRKVDFEIKARIVGPLIHRLASVALGSHVGFAGFIGSHRNGKGILFHVIEIDESPVLTQTASTN
jgi:primosomal replication protein N